MTRTITNPNAAFGAGVSDVEKYPSTISEFVAAAAVAAADVVVINATLTTSVGLSVRPGEAGVDGATEVIGVALTGGAAGDTILVVTAGYAVVNIGDSTAYTLGQSVTLDTGTQDGTALNVTADGDDIAGIFFGVVLGAEVGTTERAPVWVDRH